MSVEEDIWTRFLASLPYSERVVFAFGTVGVHIFTFWLLNGILAIMYKFNAFPSLRISNGTLPDPILQRKCLVHLIITHFIGQPLFTYALLYPVFVKIGCRINEPIPPISEFLVTFLVALAVNDTGSYWFHRLLHHRLLYKRFHKQHHDFNITMGIAAEYVNPVEDILANVIPGLAGCILMKCHVLVLWAWIALIIYGSVDNHSGYKLPFSCIIFPGKACADRHDFHHSHNTGNFGSMLIFWDWLMGTDKAYNEFKRGKTS